MDLDYEKFLAEIKDSVGKDTIIHVAESRNCVSIDVVFEEEGHKWIRSKPLFREERPAPDDFFKAVSVGKELAAKFGIKLRLA